ncbi:MAG: hypothetical protein NUV57_03605 [archaeon]|nr:hypothetical protein [archaeon]
MVYYLIPYLAAIILGTASIKFITTFASFQNATLKNGFIFISGIVILTAFFDAFIPNTELISIALYLISYYFLIKAIYNAPLDKTLILLTLSMIFKTILSLVLLDYTSSSLIGFLF